MHTTEHKFQNKNGIKIPHSYNLIDLFCFVLVWFGFMVYQPLQVI